MVYFMELLKLFASAVQLVCPRFSSLHPQTTCASSQVAARIRPPFPRELARNAEILPSTASRHFRTVG